MTEDLDQLATYLMYTDDTEPPKANKVLGGLKITGSHLHKIELPDGRTIEVPSVSYVKLLEEQIRELRYEIRVIRQKAHRADFVEDYQTNKINTLERQQKKKLGK